MQALLETASQFWEGVVLKSRTVPVGREDNVSTDQQPLFEKIRFELVRCGGSGCRVKLSGFRVQGSGFRVQCSGFRAEGLGFAVDGVVFRVQC